MNQTEKETNTTGTREREKKETKEWVRQFWISSSEKEEWILHEVFFCFDAFEHNIDQDVYKHLEASICIIHVKARKWERAIERSNIDQMKLIFTGFMLMSRRYYEKKQPSYVSCLTIRCVRSKMIVFISPFPPLRLIRTYTNGLIPSRIRYPHCFSSWKWHLTLVLIQLDCKTISVDS